MSTAIAISDYPALSKRGGALDILSAMQSNLGAGETFSQWDLNRIEMPQGKGRHFQIEMLDGVKSVEEITGVIVYHQTSRAYFESQEVKTGTPPDCVSPDGLVGFGRLDIERGTPQLPSGGFACSSCAFAKFESARQGKGQACKMRRPLYILTEEYGALPLLLNTPPASISNLHKYSTQLGKAGLQHYQVVTTLGLDLVSDASNPYSKVTFKYDGLVDDGDADQILSIREGLVGALEGSAATDPAESVVDEIPF